jgi:HNH endonuclease
MPTRVARITLICTYEPCHTPFEVLPWRKDRAKYCSKRCHMLANHPQREMTLADRFWSKVLKGAPEICWLWQGGKTGRGYGVMRVPEQKRNVGAHVISWYLQHGTWPPEGMDVLHNCPEGDRPDCVNWSHLWLGTHTENLNDMVAKERHANQFKQVGKAVREEIVALYLTGAWTYDQLGRKYELSSQSIYTYVRNHRKRMHTE